ncbi:hypothetical protein [Maricaulis maris]|uniref:hypothetical protein n=1 Tax=Maricaulis maris TaxID=74318 RepID=UPI003B8E0DE1
MNAIELAHMVMVAARHTRCDLTDEKRTQADLAEAFAQSLDVPVEREYRLSASDIPDFLVDGQLVVEVKLKAARPIAIHKQLSRYAAHDQVQGVVLLANRAMALPPDIRGKPAFVQSLGEAWL